MRPRPYRRIPTSRGRRFPQCVARAGAAKAASARSTNPQAASQGRDGRHMKSACSPRAVAPVEDVSHRTHAPLYPKRQRLRLALLDSDPYPGVYEACCCSRRFHGTHAENEAGGFFRGRLLGHAEAFFQRLKEGVPRDGRMNSPWTPLKRRILSLLSIAIAGCMLVGPDFRRPSSPIAAKWNEAGDAHLITSYAEYRDWWTVFNDADLTHLVGLAYQNNLSLRQAGVRVLEARAQLGIAIGEFYPQQQTLGASLSYNRIPGSLPYILNKNTYWSDAFGAQAAWEIDFWGKLRRAIESADDAFLASVANYDNALVSLVADVATTYVQIRTIEAQIAIAHENVERQKTALKIARAKFLYGTATKRDVYQAEDVLGATEATIPQLSIQLAQSQNALSVLLGAPPEEVVGSLTPSSSIPTTQANLAVGVPAE